MKSPDGSERTQELGSVFTSESLKDLDLSAEEHELLADIKAEMAQSRQVKLAREILKDDEFTREHSGRVAELAVAIAIREGLGRSALELLYLAGEWHDTGKTTESIQELVHASRNLTSEEMQEVRKHPEESARLAKDWGVSHTAVQIILGHHSLEKNPYPDGFEPYLSKEVDKPMHDFIMRLIGTLAVADQYDSMRSERPYRGIMLRGDALKNIHRNYTGPIAPLDALIDLTHKQ